MRQGLISAGEIAERLGIQCQTVYLWVRQRRIPFYRVGRLVKFDELEVLERFKGEADKQESSNGHATERIAIRRNVMVDPRRALGSNSSQTTEQSERYSDAQDGRVAALLVRGCTAKKGARKWQFGKDETQASGSVTFVTTLVATCRH